MGSGEQTSTSSIPAVTLSGVIVEGRVEPARSVWLGFQLTGEVEDIKVKEGQTVKSGDILATLGNPEAAQAELKTAKLDLLTAQQALDDLEQNAALDEAQAYQALVEAELAAIDAHQTLSDMDTQDYQDKIDDAWEDVQDARDDLNDAQESFDKYKNLGEDNATRKNAQTELDDAQKTYDEVVRKHQQLIFDLEQARANVDVADQAVTRANQDYAVHQDGPDPDQLERVNAQVDSAQARVSSAQKALDLMTLTAPFDGIVTLVDITVGQTISPGEKVIRLADFSEWYVETTDLDEIKVVKINRNKPVVITVDALPSLTLAGTVDQISLDYTERSGDILYTVRVLLDESDPRLRWGMTTSVNFSE
jgi:multidrug resistance efflux pump